MIEQNESCWPNLFNVKATLSSGRVGVATRDIIAGNIILLEDPFSCVLPATHHESSALQFSYDNYEVGALIKIKELSASKVKGDLCILAYRIMKKIDRDPIFKDLFLGLCHNCSRERSGLYEYSIILAELLRMGNMKGEYSVDYLRSIISRISTNAFSIVDDCFDEMGIGIYLKAACFNHSCSPNAFQSFDSKLRISIRALRDIRKSEEITVSYIDLSRPTWWRRSELYDGYNFICNCDRCEEIDYIDTYFCHRLECNGLCFIQHQEENQYRNWLRGSDCTEPIAFTSHLQYSLPVPLRYFSVSGSDETSKPWSDISMACSTCGQDRSAAQKKKLSKKFEAICDRYTHLVKQSNRLRSQVHGGQSSEDICRQWYALLDLMMESHLPPQHYCFCIVRTSLRNLQEDNMLLSLQGQGPSNKKGVKQRREVARNSAELIVNWRALLGCMLVCYPRKIPSPRFFVEGLRYAQHTLAAIQSSREDVREFGDDGNGQDLFVQELDIAWRRLHLNSLPGSSHSRGSGSGSSRGSSDDKDKVLLRDLHNWLLPVLVRDISVLVPHGHSFYSQLDAVRAELRHILQ